MHFSSYSDIAKLFEEKSSFILTTHVNPDGDGLGCEYAFYYLLISKGKQVRIINHSAVPDNYSFMNTDSLFKKYNEDQHGPLIASADVIIMLDMNESRRLVAMENNVRLSNATKVVIDHHLHPKEFADYYLLDEEACATGEILYSLFQPINAFPLSYEIALGLYVAIMTDTGSFRFPRTTPKVHAMAASLLQTGIKPEIIYQKIYDEYPFGRTQLLGKILSSIELCCDGNITISRVTQEMFQETNTTETDVENVVNYGLSICDVQATILLVELNDGVKISFRSRGKVDVSTVAQEFGGGGHFNASGARLFHVTLSEIEDRVKKMFESRFMKKEV